VRVEPKHVVLCGLSGAGKSTVGPLLAKRLRRPFRDIDRAIESDAGASVREIFARDGEPAFRERERAAVERALADAAPAVIALGGGALEDDATLAATLRHTLVFLDAPVSVLVPRVGGNDRPLLAGDPAARLAALAERRAARYRRAHVVVDATRPPAAVVGAICAAIKTARPQTELVG
jgi:shikimate kinase